MKIAIVGGGLSGSTLAIALLQRRKDIEITIYEARDRPRGICAGGIGFFAYKRIEERIPQIRHIMHHYALEDHIYTAKICVATVKDYERRELDCVVWDVDSFSTDTLGYIINRAELDNQLLLLAERFGAEVHRNTKAEILDGRTVMVGDYIKRIKEYDYVIDARGFEGYKMPNSREWEYTLQYWIKSDIYDKHAIIIDFNRDLIKHGYAWIFSTYTPRGAKVGFGEKIDHYTGRLKDTFKNAYVKGEIYKSGACLLPLNNKPKIYEDGVFKVGTAAGLVDPLTGGGIRYAIESAYALAKSLSKSRRATYIKYRAKLVRIFNEMRLSNYVKKKIEKMDVNAQLKLIRKIKTIKPKSTKIYWEVIKNIHKIVFA